ncbi:hypothetical protein [Cohnella lupini]|uniref:Uncharacterized protein n=1 Tax=Cohnella lupini TaxID=1294267 RepID=A0A3D9HZB3_9BACL|nr:hypothetical protein [Cohnella lupini]RED54775.1 hypothetical protein DFP95_12131 [Cohnella lupini]
MGIVKRKPINPNIPDFVGLKLDERGRVSYHPDYHPRNGEPFSEEEKIYLCKYQHIDGTRKIGWALGRTESNVDVQLKKLKRHGLYEIYKGMSDEEWESILQRNPSDPSQNS